MVGWVTSKPPESGLFITDWGDTAYLNLRTINVQLLMTIKTPVEELITGDSYAAQHAMHKYDTSVMKLRNQDLFYDVTTYV